MSTALSLNSEERATLNGDFGETRQKLMRTMVLYAQALDADHLVEVEGPGHLVIPDSRSGWGARLEFLEEVAGAGLTTAYPFTMDPVGPYKVSALDLTPKQRAAMDERALSD